MKTIVSEKRLRAMLEQKLLNESTETVLSDDDINKKIINIKSRGLAKVPAFAELHSMTKELSSSSMKVLIGASELVKSYADSSSVWSSHGFDQDDYWKNVVNIDPTARSSSGGGLSSTYAQSFPKITEGFKTDVKPLVYILDDMKGGSLTPPQGDTAASNIQITDQDMLTFLEDTSYVKSVADGHEAFAALLFAKYLNMNFTITPSTEKGMDCISEDGTISIEVKGSSKAEPQTNFSGSLPKYSASHFYLFLATDRSYIIRSDLLRRYYMLSQFNEEDQEESFYRRSIKDSSLGDSSGNLPNLSTLRNFMITASPGDEKFDNIKTQNYATFTEAINSDDTPDEVKTLYYKMLSEVESQTETLAATLIQSLLGFEGTERINPPELSFLGLKVYLRPVLKGVKNQQDPSLPGLETGLDKGRSQVYTLGGSLHPNYKRYITTQITTLVGRIKRNYNYSSVNRRSKLKILAHIITSVGNQINELAEKVFNDILETYNEENLTIDVYNKLKEESLAAVKVYKEAVAAYKNSVVERQQAIDSLAASLSEWATMTQSAKNKAIKAADIKKTYPLVRPPQSRPKVNTALLNTLRNAAREGLKVTDTSFGTQFVESIRGEIEDLKQELTSKIAEEANNLKATLPLTRLFEEKNTKSDLYGCIIKDIMEAAIKKRKM